MLTGYYDLSCCPPTYDFVTFLLQLERRRLELGEAETAIEILPGPVGGFREDNLWPGGSEARETLLGAIVRPLCGLLPSCGSVLRRPDRPPAAVPAYGYGHYGIGPGP